MPSCSAFESDDRGLWRHADGADPLGFRRDDASDVRSVPERSHVLVERESGHERRRACEIESVVKIDVPVVETAIDHGDACALTLKPGVPRFGSEDRIHVPLDRAERLGRSDPVCLLGDLGGIDLDGSSRLRRNPLLHQIRRHGSHASHPASAPAESRISRRRDGDADVVEARRQPSPSRGDVRRRRGGNRAAVIDHVRCGARAPGRAAPTPNLAR